MAFFSTYTAFNSCHVLVLCILRNIKVFAILATVSASKILLHSPVVSLVDRESATLALNRLATFVGSEVPLRHLSAHNLAVLSDS